MLTIGQVAARTGLAVSAIRFYEAEGLVFPARSAAGQRRFARADLRRLSFVKVAVEMGFALGRIKAEMAHLPKDRAPSRDEWARIAEGFRADIDARIGALTRLRDQLEGCIGCGCLSMKACALYNPDDIAGQNGPGARYLLASTEKLTD